MDNLNVFQIQDVVVLKWKDLLNTTCKKKQSASVIFYCDILNEVLIIMILSASF